MPSLHLACALPAPYYTAARASEPPSNYCKLNKKDGALCGTSVRSMLAKRLRIICASHSPSTAYRFRTWRIDAQRQAPSSPALSSPHNGDGVQRGASSICARGWRYTRSPWSAEPRRPSGLIWCRLAAWSCVQPSSRNVGRVRLGAPPATTSICDAPSPPQAGLEGPGVRALRRDAVAAPPDDRTRAQPRRL